MKNFKDKAGVRIKKGDFFVCARMYADSQNLFFGKVLATSGPKLQIQVVTDWYLYELQNPSFIHKTQNLFVIPKSKVNKKALKLLEKTE
jgi:hypothetical protein